MLPSFAVSVPGFDFLVEAFAHALKYCYDLTGSFGLAIILITIGMRTVLLPLTIKQTRSMIAMQRLQPQLKDIQKKHKDDRDKQGREMMKLYKENKVSPLGGCLPLILQLPIIFAIFQVLHNLSNAESTAIKIIGDRVNFAFLGMDMRLTGSTLWSVEEAYAQIILLVLFTVVTGYVSAKMMITDPKQSKLMAMMPVMMGVFAIILPAGVTIYIVVTNILTFTQQYVQLEREGFYDEKRLALEKSGNMEKWQNSMKFRFIEYGSKTLMALRIKPETPKKRATKPAVKKAGGKAKAGKASAKKSAKPSTAKKRPSGRKAPATGKKAHSGKKAKPREASSEKMGSTASKKATSKGYPAKKKGKGK